MTAEYEFAKRGGPKVPDKQKPATIGRLVNDWKTSHPQLQRIRSPRGK